MAFVRYGEIKAKPPAKVANSAGHPVKGVPRHKQSVKHKIGKPKVPVIFGGM